ncbi:MAG: 2-hydroxyacid dehydrogenase [Planctomycetota bacterium]
MKVAVFSTKPYDREFLAAANEPAEHELRFLEPKLVAETARLADGCDAVCAFVNDTLDAEVLGLLADGGVRAVALRCAGFNNVDLDAARTRGIAVVRVPAYSPHAVAEHAVGLILALNRHLHRAYTRVRDGNFALSGLLGFDLHGKTIGVVGTGAIGSVFARILSGFGCRLLGFDVRENPACVELGMKYVAIDSLLAQSDIVSLHCPLTPETHHLIDAAAIERCKPGVMIVNTSRGAVVDTAAVIGGLKSGRVGSLAIDVYEEEGDVFFEDLSDRVIPDDTLARLLTFPNVLITGHQAFFTREAMTAIAETTLRNLTELDTSGDCANRVD